jgi:hypothetical protein
VVKEEVWRCSVTGSVTRGVMGWRGIRCGEEVV